MINAKLFTKCMSSFDSFWSKVDRFHEKYYLLIRICQCES